MTLTVGPNTVVSIAVEMFDAQGNLLESTEGEGVPFLFGHHDIFPAVEKALEGKKVGDKLSLTLEPEDAFGDLNTDLMQMVSEDQLGGEVEEGMRFEGIPGQENDGRIYTVTASSEGQVLLDANHPLAGYTIKLNIEVKTVQSVSDEDIEVMEKGEATALFNVIEPSTSLH